MLMPLRIKRIRLRWSQEERTRMQGYQITVVKDLQQTLQFLSNIRAERRYHLKTD